MRKSTLSHTTVFLLQMMRFAKLDKPPLSIKSPQERIILVSPQKCLKKISLIEDLRYTSFFIPQIPTKLLNTKQPLQF